MSFFFFFEYNLITKLSANPTGGKKLTNQCVSRRSLCWEPVRQTQGRPQTISKQVWIIFANQAPLDICAVSVETTHSRDKHMETGLSSYPQHTQQWTPVTNLKLTATLLFFFQIFFFFFFQQHISNVAKLLHMCTKDEEACSRAPPAHCLAAEEGFLGWMEENRRGVKLLANNEIILCSDHNF